MNDTEIFFKEYSPFKELRRYSENELKEIIGDNDSLLKDLQKYDYIKFDKEKEEYVFKFVGVILIDNKIFKCYPKYIPDDIIDDVVNEEQKKDDFKETMRVIRKYHKQKENFNQDMIKYEDTSSSMLSLMLFFIEDYYENGVYTNYQLIYELNGNGEINWNRTINNHNPILKKKNKKPYYIEMETRYNLNNINDYFRLLHEYIITESSKILKKIGLLELFDLTPVEISYKKRNEFGNKKEILENIEKERRVEFNTHKRKLLKYMYYYIANEKTFANQNIISVYGTSSYHVIWEKICANVLNDKLKKNTSEELSNINLDKKFANKKLKEIIEKPTWIFKSGKSFETDSLIPDLITLNEDTFVILDAKYYDITFEEDELKGQPGLESVTKQYLYELSYKEFINNVDFEKVSNAFLFPNYDFKKPVETQEVINKGCIKLDFLTDSLVNEIQILMLPVSKMNKLYLQNKSMKISELKLNN